MKNNGRSLASDSNTEKLIVRNLQQSEKYRCLVSNQAGRTVSNTSTVIKPGTHLFS